MFVTNTDRVRASIENQIVTGTLPPGTTLDESMLSKQFSVSRTPVREALLQLSMEGYIKIVPRSGIYVVRLSAHELADMFDMLAHAEGMCARLVVQRITPPQIRALQELHSEGRKAVVQKDIAAYVAYNQAFHEFLYACCNNAYLVRQIMQIRKRTNPYRQREFEYTDLITGSWREHDRLLTAIVAGDEIAAMLEAINHIRADDRADPRAAAMTTDRREPFADSCDVWNRTVDELPCMLGGLASMH